MVQRSGWQCPFRKPASIVKRICCERELPKEFQTGCLFALAPRRARISDTGSLPAGSGKDPQLLLLTNFGRDRYVVDVADVEGCVVSARAPVQRFVTFT